jgi:hypothetical protein
MPSPVLATRLNRLLIFTFSRSLGFRNILPKILYEYLLTTDAYRSFGNEITLYIQRASLEIIPKIFPVAVLQIHIEE